jgi:hypothetical protein
MKKNLLLAAITLGGGLTGLSYGQRTNSSPPERIYDAHPFSRPNVFKVGDNSANAAASTNAPITDQDHHNHASTLHFNEYDKPHSLAPHASEIAHASGGQLWDMERSWWNGTSASANWFGLGFPLKDRGINVSGEFKQVYYGLAQGGMPNMPKSLWLTEVKLKGIFDFEKIFGDYARGFSFVTNWRYRNRGDDPQNAMGIPISQLSESSNSGLGMRIMTQYLQWQSDGSKDPSLVVHAGWENPYEYFIQQPLSKLFELNSVNASKGIGATLGNGIAVANQNGTKEFSYRTTGVPWTSSYATWGGTLRVKPSCVTYIQSGLYAAISRTDVNPSIYRPTDVYPYTAVSPQYVGTYRSTGKVLNSVGVNGQPNGKTTTQGWVATPANNHGFFMQGAPKFNPQTQNIGVAGADPGMNGNYTSNGIYTVNEVGWTPKFGKLRELEGKYVFGGYIWGQPNSSFTPTAYSSYATTKPLSSLINQCQWGLYWQADQRLTAVREEEPDDSTDAAPGATISKVTKKGLYSINMVNYTPPQNNILPFYAHTGLVYRGLIPKRNDDMLGFVAVFAVYSSYFNDYLKTQNEALVQNYGTTPNAVVPDGPTTASLNQLGAPTALNPGSKTSSANKKITAANAAQNTYYAYRPMFSTTEELEAFYSIQVNQWSAIKPYAQYIINPSGNGTLGNELILGVRFTAAF